MTTTPALKFILFLCLHFVSEYVNKMNMNVNKLEYSVETLAPAVHFGSGLFAFSQRGFLWAWRLAKSGKYGGSSIITGTCNNCTLKQRVSLLVHRLARDHTAKANPAHSHLFIS